MHLLIWHTRTSSRMVVYFPHVDLVIPSRELNKSLSTNILKVTSILFQLLVPVIRRIFSLSNFLSKSQKTYFDLNNPIKYTHLILPGKSTTGMWHILKMLHTISNNNVISRFTVQNWKKRRTRKEQWDSSDNSDLVPLYE